MRVYVRCRDCLSYACVEVQHFNDVHNAACATCGGNITIMGEVKGNQWFRTTQECKCNERCVDASGPNCECSCGGKNHGTGIMGYIDRIAETGQVKIILYKGDARKRIAEEYRTAKAAAKERIKGLPGYQDYINHVWIQRSYWETIHYAELDFYSACKYTNHKNRIKHLEKIPA